jgi:hypothetical protein
MEELFSLALVALAAPGVTVKVGVSMVPAEAAEQRGIQELAALVGPGTGLLAGTALVAAVVVGVLRARTLTTTLLAAAAALIHSGKGPMELEARLVLFMAVLAVAGPAAQTDSPVNPSLLSTAQMGSAGASGVVAEDSASL